MSSSTKMSLLSISYSESNVYRRQNNKHFAELALQNGGKQLIWRNYVIITLWIPCGRRAWRSRRSTFRQRADRSTWLWRCRPEKRCDEHLSAGRPCRREDCPSGRTSASPTFGSAHATRRTSVHRRTGLRCGRTAPNTRTKSSCYTRLRQKPGPLAAGSRVKV